MTKKFKSKKNFYFRICNNKNLLKYLDLGSHPPSNSFISESEIASEQFFPLKVILCENCGLSQLDTIISSEDIFDEYLYLSSTSKALVNHYADLTKTIIRKFEPDEKSLIVDIGCNDGITLKSYPKNKFNLLGIEPSSSAEFAKKIGLKIEEEFFSHKFSKILRSKYGKASIITATNVFAHVHDICDFVNGISNFLHENGIFIIEFPYLKNMLEDNFFDLIYHEHLSYLSVTPLDYLFSKYNLKIFDIDKVNVGASGPGLRVYVSHKNSKYYTKEIVFKYLSNEKKQKFKNIETYISFSNKVLSIKNKIVELILKLNKENQIVGAYGAPAKGNTMLNFLGLDKSQIKIVADNTPLKIGKVTPGTHIPIVSDEDFEKENVNYALLLTWNYLEFFLKNSNFIKKGGKFIVPFPKPQMFPK